MTAEKRVAIPKAMGAKKVGAEEEDAKLTLATHLVDQCARAQLQMRKAMSEMCKARNFAYTIAKELEQTDGARELVARALEDEKKTELQRVKGDNKRLKVALEEKEARLKRAKMHNSCLVADCQGLKAQLEKTEAELHRANMHNSCLAADFQGLKVELEETKANLAPMIVCDCEIDSDVEWGLGDSENRI